MINGYRLVVRHPMKLLAAILDEFRGDGRLSLEGDLSQCDLRGISVVANEPIGVLRRNTLYPQQDFVVLPLDADTPELIKRQILPRVGIRNRVIHLPIEKGGKLVFAAYDPFDPDCVWI